MEFQKKLLCSLVGIFLIGQAAFAQLMPVVNQEVTIKSGDSWAAFRYYSPLDVTKIIDPFEVKWKNGDKIKLVQDFNYYTNGGQDYVTGQVQGGKDQYAQYFKFSGLKPGALEISGPFAEAAYFSLVIYNSQMEVTQEIQGKDLSVSQGKANPYVAPHKSILYYTADEYRDIPTGRPSHFDTVPQFDINIPFYRSDKYTSGASEEDIAPDGCSRAYLVTGINAKQPNYMLLKIKMPTTFFRHDTRDTIYRGYDVEELSISSTMNHLNDQLPTLDFWSVNSYLLSKLNNVDGYAYILFAPRNIVQELVTQQHLLNSRTPPMVNLGEIGKSFNAYVLGTPTHAIVMRYRNPDDKWIGSPVHTSCYATPQTDLPVKDGALGEYTPVIKGATSYPELDKLINHPVR